MLTPPHHYSIGSWSFSPRDNELRRGDERRRLEDRAARTLELLCRHRGETVSGAAIIDQVWNGRHLSPNSVAVVISGLRAALGDDARAPHHIETVAKRGYRLVDADSLAIAGGATPHAQQRRLIIVTVLALVLVAALALALLRADSPAPAVYFSRVVNDTGSVRYEPVARSVDGLIEGGLARGRVRQMRLLPGQNLPEGAVALEARLILWTGRPTINFIALDPSGEVVWSGMAGGPPQRFPNTVGGVIEDLAERLRTRDE